MGMASSFCCFLGECFSNPTSIYLEIDVKDRSGFVSTTNKLEMKTAVSERTILVGRTNERTQ
jgi:hypothetical protein